MAVGNATTIRPQGKGDSSTAGERCPPSPAVSSIGATTKSPANPDSDSNVVLEPAPEHARTTTSCVVRLAEEPAPDELPVKSSEEFDGRYGEDFSSDEYLDSDVDVYRPSAETFTPRSQGAQFKWLKAGAPAPAQAVVVVPPIVGMQELRDKKRATINIIAEESALARPVARPAASPATSPAQVPSMTAGGEEIFVKKNLEKSILGGARVESYGTLGRGGKEKATPPFAQVAAVLANFKSLELNSIRGRFAADNFALIGPTGAFEAEWVHRCCQPSLVVLRNGGPGGKTFAVVEWKHDACCATGTLTIRRVHPQQRLVARGSVRRGCWTDQIDLIRVHRSEPFKIRSNVSASGFWGIGANIVDETGRPIAHMGPRAGFFSDSIHLDLMEEGQYGRKLVLDEDKRLMVAVALAIMAGRLLLERGLEKRRLEKTAGKK